PQPDPHPYPPPPPHKTQRVAIQRHPSRLWVQLLADPRPNRRSAMLIAYFTTDEVNEWAAERLAAECGLTLCPMFLKGEPAGEGFDAMIFDWDFLPAPWREEALTMLT